MADIKIVLSADASKVDKQLAKTLSAVVNMFDKAAAKSKSAADQSGESWKNANKKGFGSNAVSQMKTYLAGVVGVAAAVRGIASAWNYTIERTNAAAESMRNALASSGSLAQVTKTNEEFQMANAKARQIFKLGGAENINEANRTVFELYSAGLTSEQDVLFAAQGRGVFDTSSVIQSGGKLRDAMGAAEVGGLSDIVSKGIAAAGPVGGANAAQMLQAATKPAAMASKLKLTDEELLGALQVIARTTESPDIAGTQLNRLLTDLEMMGAPAGAGLVNIMASAKDMTKDMSPSQLKKIMPKDPARKAFFQLTKEGGIEKLQQAISDIEDAQEGGEAGRAIRRARSYPQFEAARMALAAKNKRESFEMEKRAVGRNVREAAIEADAAEMEAQGRGWWTRFVRETGNRATGWMGSDDVYERWLKKKIKESDQDIVGAGGNSADPGVNAISNNSSPSKPVLVEFNNVGKDPVIPSWDPRYTGK